MKAGRLLFRSPILGVISLLPTAIFIYRGSKPLVSKINSWVDRDINNFTNSNGVVEVEVIQKDDS
tara:strand:- start:272 stop:466 length:195 start_codon:yes stop_codon:yes gene_type:complete